jgi:hemoglobin
MSAAKELSLYEQIGGERAVEAAVEIFYRRVNADPLLQSFFAGRDMKRLTAMQRGFLTLAFGGPNLYTGRGMRSAHAPLVQRGLSDAHFDAVLDHLDATLEEMGVSPQLRKWARALTEPLRKDVLNR